MGYEQQYDVYRTAVETYLRDIFAGFEAKPYHRLQEAMTYSLLSGGKRVRPVLTLAFCELAGGEAQKALPFGCALELVHTYSLIHDDLPCMDNDDFRRGKPTNHKVYGETLAVLAGDALQAEAFRLIAQAPDMTGDQKAKAVETLSLACGGNGMVAGQVLDVDHLATDAEALTELHRLKTGAMIQGAAMLGIIAADGGEELLRRSRDYAAHLGLAFQIRDDMLDIIGDQAEFGKPVGSDRDEGKLTFPELLGIDGCAALVEEETRKAKAAIQDLPNSAFLLELADRMVSRRS